MQISIITDACSIVRENLGGGGGGTLLFWDSKFGYLGIKSVIENATYCGFNVHVHVCIQ